MAQSETHRWEFMARFRRHAFGWRSQPAVTRVRQAVAEIRKVARREPVLAAEGAIADLVPVIAKAPAERAAMLLEWPGLNRERLDAILKQHGLSF